MAHAGGMNGLLGRRAARGRAIVQGRDVGGSRGAFLIKAGDQARAAALFR